MVQPVSRDFTKKLPKIELHAHLSGSISRECLHDIWLGRKIVEPNLDLEDPLTALPRDNDVNVQTFFPLFHSYIYKLLDNLKAIRKSTNQVLQDFEADNVRYLELRTTPRVSLNYSKEEYVKTVLDVIADYQCTGRDVRMRTKLILSIDRRNTRDEAQETIGLARRFKAQGIVGIDLCGDPSRQNIRHLLPALEMAKPAGLQLTLHFAEIPVSSTDEELQALLDLKPDRLGHVIHVSEAFKERIVREHIGVELCLSCNVKSGLTGDYPDHHFGWWKNNHSKIAICTDDVGIFCAPLSEEYFQAALHYNLDAGRLILLSKNVVDLIFDDAFTDAGSSTKIWLRQQIDDFRDEWANTTLHG